MAHSHSMQRFILETLNWENLSYIHYIEFHHSLYNIYNVFRYSVNAKTLIRKTGIIFSKPLKIAKTAQIFFSGCCPEPRRPRLRPMPSIARNLGGHTCPPRTPLGKRTRHKQDTSKRDRQTQLSYLTHPHTHMQRI
jgi:hypothetical protein